MRRSIRPERLSVVFWVTQPQLKNGWAGILTLMPGFTPWAFFFFNCGTTVPQEVWEGQHWLVHWLVGWLVFVCHENQQESLEVFLRTYHSARLAGRSLENRWGYGFWSPPPNSLSVPEPGVWNLELLDLEPLAPPCPVLTIQMGAEQNLELLFSPFHCETSGLWPHSLFLDCVRCLNPGASVLGIVLGTTAHRRASKTQPWS